MIQASREEFFSSLLKEEATDISRFDLSLIPNLVSETDNAMLCAVPTLEEVKEAAFATNKNSVARPDGFSSFFYQYCWHIITKDLLLAVVEFFYAAE